MSYQIHGCSLFSGFLSLGDYCVLSSVSCISTSVCLQVPFTELSSSDKNSWFFFALITKILSTTLPCHTKYHLKKMDFWVSHNSVYYLHLSALEGPLLPLCVRKFSLCCFFWTQVSIAFCLSSIPSISGHLSRALC